MSLVLSGSTSGSVTLQEPAVAGTTVLDLPATSGNVVVDSATQTLTNKSIVATQLTGTIAAARLPAGSVLQVVQGTQPAGVTNAGGTMITTGLTVSITPKFDTSKVLLFVNGFGRTAPKGWINFMLYRNGSVVYDIVGGFNYQSDSTITTQLAAVYLDSPATTASTTYALFFQNVNGTADWNADPRITTITAMEIAA